MAKKGTLQVSKALTMGFGIQAGTIRLMDGRFKIVERGKEGAEKTGMMLLQFDVSRVDGELKVINPDDVVQQDLVLCFRAKETGTYFFHPAKGTSATDDNPVDLGTAVDTEGNTYCVPEGSDGSGAPFADSEASLFGRSLEKLGFKPELNDQAWIGNYVGLVLQVETIKKEDLCKKLGVRHNPMAPKPGQEARAQTAWDVVKVLNLDEHQARLLGKSKGKGASASTPASTASSSSASKANGAPDFDVPTAVLEFAQAVQKEHAGKEMAKAAFKQEIYKKALKAGASKVPVKFHKAINDYSSSEDGIMALAGEEVLVPVTNDEGVVTGVTLAGG